jgi:hypothetical protein
MFEDLNKEAEFSRAALPKPTQDLPLDILSKAKQIHFVLETGPITESITNILCIAAVFRAIAIKQGAEPELKILTESQLWNRLNGNGGLFDFLEDARQQTVLLLSAASIYRSQYANLYGQYYLEAVTLIDNLEIVSDEIKLGQRQDTHKPIIDFIGEQLAADSDSTVQELKKLAEFASKSISEPRLEQLSHVLETLDIESCPWPIHKPKALELIPSIESLIKDLARGIKELELVKALESKYDDAQKMAAEIWSRADEIAPTVFVMEGIPYSEQDRLVTECLKKIYLNDIRAKFVLEHSSDPSANLLRYDEALQYSRRLSVGEEAQELLDEIKSILEKRGDKGTMLDICLAEDRDRDATDILEPILEKAQYIRDPDGKYEILKSPLDDMYAELQRLCIPLVTHSALWMVDLKNGKSRPFGLYFQAKQLQRFLDEFVPV